MSDMDISLNLKIGAGQFQAAPASTTSTSPDKNKALRSNKVQLEDGKCYFGAWLGVMPQEGGPLDNIVWDGEYSYPHLKDSYDKYRIKQESMTVFRKAIKDFAGLTGKDPAIVMSFNVLNDGYKDIPFPKTFCEEVSAQGKIPMVTLEFVGLPFKASDNMTYLEAISQQLKAKSGPIYEKVARWAKQAAIFGKPFLLRPFHEANLSDSYDWTAWMNGGEAGLAHYKEAWRELYSLFQEIAPNATFVWCLDARSRLKSGWNQMDRYNPDYDYDTKTRTYKYAGNYFDCSGLDSYRKSDSQLTFEDVFVDPHGISAPWQKFIGIMNSNGTMKKDKQGKVIRYNSMDYIKSLNKPLMICETSSINDAGKADFIKGLFEAKEKYGLSGIIWFNENKAGKGIGEFNWPVDAPVLTKKENIAKGLQLSLSYCESREDSIAVCRSYKVPFPLPASSPAARSTDVNVALDAMRKYGTDPDQFYFRRVNITVNNDCKNVQTEPPLVKPLGMRSAEKRARRIESYLTSWKRDLFPLLNIDYSELSISVAGYKEELSGYQQFTVKDTSGTMTDLLPLMSRQHELAFNAMSSVSRNDRTYLKSLAKQKDIYALWEGITDEEKAAIHEKCDMTCDTLIKLASDTSYIGQFENRVLNKFGGFFDLLDVTKFKDREPLGFTASAYATKADIRIAKGVDLGGAEAYYDTAVAIVSGKQFSRGKVKTWLAGELLKVIDERAYKDVWWGAPLKAVLRPIYYLKTVDFLNIADPDNDLKTSIEIGRAKKKLLKSDRTSIDDGVSILEKIVNDPNGISPALRLKAKLELARGIGLYAGLDYSSREEMMQNIEKAKKAIIIYKELLGGAIGSTAATECTKLSKLIKQAETSEESPEDLSKNIK